MVADEKSLPPTVPAVNGQQGTVPEFPEKGNVKLFEKICANHLDKK